MSLTNRFEARIHSGTGGRRLPYRLFVPPGYTPAQKYPLVLFLHGAGERGDDNERQLLIGPGATVWTEPADAQKHPCIVVAPQCPSDHRWANVQWNDPLHRQAPEPTAEMQMVMEILAGLEDEWSVDPDRLYITGLSMGGHGTWDAITRWPGRFAAAVPVCGGGDESLASRITHLPLWAFHGDADDVVPVERSRTMIEAMRKAGGSPRYTEYAGVGHNSWDCAYNEPDLMGWLFDQRRGQRRD